MKQYRLRAAPSCWEWSVPGLLFVAPTSQAAATSLQASAPEDSVDVVTAFRRGLGERGMIEGRNVLVEFRWANGDYARLPALAAELVGRPVSVLVAAGPPAAYAARAATSTIPI